MTMRMRLLIQWTRRWKNDHKPDPCCFLDGMADVCLGVLKRFDCV